MNPTGEGFCGNENIFKINVGVVNNDIRAKIENCDSSGIDECPPSTNIFKKFKLSSLRRIKHSMDYDRSLISRIIWAILVTLAAFLAIYQIGTLLFRYLEYPTYTELDIMSLRSLKFPRITICNNNYVKKSAAESLCRRVFSG
ncbi:hypothetical protein HELRODRAFT_180235 [Helobdella robusta]|uniref:Uncharacterized protein n=1 Tax=Helobdella robusta TaxID=6412 RepID=T1FFL6_HELRO|nr:hypothetical protein HELRODRAFT_180235 [Helobdella robusta]ESN94068.1 hypothetical protein HELRODRAFT_180235 [Helobdella robusta]